MALAELVHNKFSHCHEFLLKISPTSNDAFVSPCSHIHDRSVDHLRVKGSDFSSDVHLQLVQVAWPWGVNLNTECQFSIYFPVSQSWVLLHKAHFWTASKCILGFRGLKDPPIFFRSTKVDTIGCTIHTITQKYVTSCSLIVAGCLNVLGVKQSLCTIFSGTPWE